MYIQVKALEAIILQQLNNIRIYRIVVFNVNDYCIHAITLGYDALKVDLFSLKFKETLVVPNLPVQQ